MKRTLTLALGAVLLTGAMSRAQDNFPDIPDNHWAFEAIARMKAAGLLTGYPDGLFRGGRPASRYEMAVAIHAAWMHMKNITDGLQAQIDALKNMGGGGDQGLKDMVMSLQNSVDGMKNWGQNISDLQKMASAFEKELASMGVDVEALKKGLADLDRRVSDLEKRGGRGIDINGDINLWMRGGYSDDNRYGMDKTGRLLGVDPDSGDPVAGATKDMSAFHEGVIKLSGQGDGGPKWKAALVINNLMGFSSFDGIGSNAMGSMSDVLPFQGYREGDASIYFAELSATFDTSLWGQGFGASLGRVGYQAGGYFFKRPDVTPYYKSEYWDNGNWIFDGGILKFNWGNANLDVFGGRQPTPSDDNGFQINPMSAGDTGFNYIPGSSRPIGFEGGFFSIDRHLGFHLGIPLMEKGSLNLNYIMLDSDNTGSIGGSNGQVNRVTVFGGDAKFALGSNISLTGGYSQSDIGYNTDAKIDSDNAAWWVGGEYKTDNWGLGLGYRVIEPQFGAPGSWGRIGTWWNPNDIKGFHGNFWMNLGENAMVHLGGYMYNGTDTTIGVNTGLSKDDEVTGFKLGFNYKVNEAWDLMLGAELVDWDIKARGLFTGGKPEERWYSIGLNYNMSKNTFWNFMWEMSDHDAKNTSGWTSFGGVFKGGMVSTQLGIKF